MLSWIAIAATIPFSKLLYVDFLTVIFSSIELFVFKLLSMPSDNVQF